MKNYSIVTTSNIESLIKAVNEMISNGYEPIGGMFLQQGMGSLAYYQTMYKRPVVDNTEMLKKFGIVETPISDPTHGLPAVETVVTPYPDIIDELVANSQNQSPPQLIHAIKVEQKVDKRRKVK